VSGHGPAHHSETVDGPQVRSTRRGVEAVRLGLRSLRSDLTRLAGILALIGVLCAPGIISKLVGLLELGVAGASPAISVGTVVAQTPR
jgi:hypothetical protein